MEISSRQSLLLLVLLLSTCMLPAQVLHQPQPPTHQDSLRGSINEERSWWNVLHYNITVEPDYARKTISGRTIILFKVLAPANAMQIDLQEPMTIDSITLGGTSIPFQREGNVYHLHFKDRLPVGSQQAISIAFAGKPREAIRPPWDGGWIWKQDANGQPWMSVACQGLGASVWYPCKDHQSDEPDSGAVLTMLVPDTLVAVGNGRLQQHKDLGNGKSAWTWQVVNPINNYNIIPYIGKYVNFSEVFNGLKGPLDCNYWVLDYNLAKAKEQFKQVPLMLRCFEYWFGPYPFYEDGYKLVESPHLGMEHQSAVAYGNKYQNGYLGRDLSGSGWGLKWDFIIVHESGHEWFANNITSKDLADMWLHEGFTNYSETLFTECQYGKEAANEYLIGSRKNIANDIPVIGTYGINREGSGDMYCKGGSLLHTIRQVINNDSVFVNILRGLNKTFYHQTVTTQQVENYISRQGHVDLSKVFDQYLRTTQVPVFEYKIERNTLQYRYTNCINGFNLPIKLLAGKEYWLKPGTQWQSMKLPAGIDEKEIKVDRNFYVKVQQTAGSSRMAPQKKLP
ncbi:MAG TPA: M1 family metallopeptidase [Chitinophagaceae bacterium]|nr:M1 family metallopeptidase [Chitinophagaceae bacterium]